MLNHLFIFILLFSQFAFPIRRCRDQVLVLVQKAGLNFLEREDLEKTGITRKKFVVGGKKGNPEYEFKYYYSNGKEVKDAKVLERLKKLGIAPAYEDVYYSIDPSSHLQAVASDSEGRRQYRHHDEWTKVAGENKFSHLLDFGESLGGIRLQASKDLSKPGISKDRVLAGIVTLLDKSLIRVGGQDSDNFGLTTMRMKFVRYGLNGMTFKFVGKSNKEHEITVDNEPVRKLLKSLESFDSDKSVPPGLKGQLFKYKDNDGNVRGITDKDVNDYLKKIGGDDVSAKDFRTWHATRIAAEYLQDKWINRGDFTPKQWEAQKKKYVKEAYELAADALGNEPSIAKKSYVHPGVIDSYLKPGLDLTHAFIHPGASPKESTSGYSFADKSLIRFLTKYYKNGWRDEEDDTSDAD